jgi:hypothetical protein
MSFLLCAVRKLAPVTPAGVGLFPVEGVTRIMAARLALSCRNWCGRRCTCSLECCSAWPSRSEVRTHPRPWACCIGLDRLERYQMQGRPRLLECAASQQAPGSDARKSFPRPTFPADRTGQPDRSRDQ